MLIVVIYVTVTVIVVIAVFITSFHPTSFFSFFTLMLTSLKVFVSQSFRYVMC